MPVLNQCSAKSGPNSARPRSRFSKAWIYRNSEPLIRIQQCLDLGTANPKSGFSNAWIWIQQTVGAQDFRYSWLT